MRNVAIVGEFASGKTTLAELLIENFGFTRVSFAGKLKSVAAAVYEPMEPGQYGSIEKTKQYEVWPLMSQPETISGREVLQQLGQAVKDMDRLFWVRWLMNDIDSGIYGDGPFVTDDCRFPYEADALRERGFVIARIMTPLDVRMDRYEATYGRRPTMAEMNHPSETEVQSIRWDLILDGMTSPTDMASNVVHAAADVRAA